jgi:hypothetical protein
MRAEHNVRFMRRACTSVGFEVLTAVVMKHSVISDITPCSLFEVNRHFGGTYHLRIHGVRISQIRYQHEAALLVTCFILVSYLTYSSTLKMEATCYSPTSIDFQQTTLRYIPEKKTSHNVYRS